MKQTEWILCPVCGSKTRSRIREDTILINYPLYCPKCRQERLIEVKKFTNNSYYRARRKVYVRHGFDAEPIKLSSLAPLNCHTYLFCMV